MNEQTINKIKGEFEELKFDESKKASMIKRLAELKENPIVKEYMELDERVGSLFIKIKSDDELLHMAISNELSLLEKENLNLYLYVGDFNCISNNGRIINLYKQSEDCTLAGKIYTNIFTHKDVIIVGDDEVSKFEKANIVLRPTYPEDLERSEQALASYVKHLEISFVERVLQYGEEEAIKYFKKKYK